MATMGNPMRKSVLKKSAAANAGKPVIATRENTYLCPYCQETKKESEYYASTDPLILTGKTVMCKTCAEKVARNYDPYLQEYGECTKASIQEALERLDKPFLDVIWDASYFEANAPQQKGKRTTKKSDIWGCYIKNISMPQYRGMRWRDGDLYSNYREQAIKEAKNMVLTVDEIQKAKEVRTEYTTNRRDVIRMIGYDPFEKYPIDEDKVVLYSQLVNFIDEETRNDGMKMNAVIQIVQSFNQIQKINDAINELSCNVNSLIQNNGTIKQYAETVNKLLSGANALAKDNGISVNFNNSKSKGADTLTGKMKELNEMGFRDAKINMYDINYCAGMQQVAEISARAQIQQIGLDENVMAEINGIRRELVDRLQKERDEAAERARVLLVENRDLKQFLKDKELIDENGKVIEYD